MIIHVGLHKTGTTYLQESGNHGEIIRRVELRNPFKLSVAELRNAVVSRFEAVRRDGLIPVNSCGWLSGSPASGQCWWAGGTERLVEACPDSEIVVTIREQGSMLASIYKQLVRNWMCCFVLDPESEGAAYARYRQMPNL